MLELLYLLIIVVLGTVTVGAMAVAGGVSLVAAREALDKDQASRRLRRDDWTDHAEELGGELVGGPPLTLVLEGGARLVRHSEGVLIEVGGVDPQLRLRRDVDVDRYQSPRAIATLTPRVRDVLRGIPVATRSGTLQVLEPDFPSRQRIDDVVVAAAALAPLEDVPGRLAERVDGEGDARIRRLLVRELAMAGVDVSAYSTDPDPSVRLTVVRHRPDEDVLVELCTHPSCRKDALGLLERLGWWRGVEIVAVDAFARNDFDTTDVALRTAARMGIGPTANLARQVLADPDAVVAATGACRILQQFGDPDDTELLVAQLEHPPVRLAAVDALARVGTPKAIPALRKLEGRASILPGSVAAAASVAIRVIRGRVDADVLGALSVSSLPREAGAVSVAESPVPGGLAIPDKAGS